MIRPTTSPAPTAAAAVLLSCVGLVLAACGGETPAGAASAATNPAGGAASLEAKADPVPDVGVDEKAAALVPEAIADRGTLVAGSDTTYPPLEFIDADGRTIVGMDVDLGRAIGKKLGLKVEFQTSPFDTLLPALGSKYDVGISSFTDTLEREQQVDFVTYYEAGTAWASRAGTSIDPDKACGRTVGVQVGTVQDTDDLPARQKVCTAAGKPIDVQRFDKQGDVTTAVVSGKVEAMLADSPVTLYAIDQTRGQLQLAGKGYDAAPYGIAVPKSEDTLDQAILLAVESLIADGSYQAVLEKWGLEDGAITTPVINGAEA